MPRNRIDPRVAEIVALLPSEGEITYEAWKEAITTAGIKGGVNATIKARQAGAVTFRNSRDGSNNLVPMVSRSGEGE